MRALTLWQPWATLIAIGAKRIETRSWRTPYRGPLAIHAGATRLRPAEILDLFEGDTRFVDALLEAGMPGNFSVRDFPRGEILAVANLVRIQSTEVARASVLTKPRELAFGDYRDGRWAWELDAITPLRNPVPCTGARGLWRVPYSVLCEVEKETR